MVLRVGSLARWYAKIAKLGIYMRSQWNSFYGDDFKPDINFPQPFNGDYFPIQQLTLVGGIPHYLGTVKPCIVGR